MSATSDTSPKAGPPDTVVIPARVGNLLLAPVCVMGTSAAVAAIDTTPSNTTPFVIGGAITLAIAIILRRFARSGTKRGSARSAIILAWIISSILSAIPFIIAGHTLTAGAESVYQDPGSALFESVSGLTSCGLTISADAHQLSAGFQWYRSALEWIGGLGLIALVASLTDADHINLLRAQRWARRAEEHRVRMHRVVSLYVALTIASCVAFLLAGMPTWESINHALTGISTGGFVITPDSFQSYTPAIKLVTMLIMLTGALSLVTLSRLGTPQRPKPLRESRVLLIYLVVVTIGIILSTTLARPPGWSRLDAAFQWTSAITTTGFSARGDMPAFPGTWILALMLIGMLVGGMSRSTAGGIKIDRILRIPRSRRARAFTIRWVLISAGAWLGLMIFTDHYPWAAAFEAVSALGTVGLSSDLIGADSGPGTKLTLILLMLIGRLEGMWLLHTHDSPDPRIPRPDAPQ
jgi:trk system potassium uptake protein TrkH